MKVINSTYKGTRILIGNEKSDYLTESRETLKSLGFTEIQIPIIQSQEVFENKVGEENNNMMYTFSDRGGRNLCLAPEYTAIIQKLAEKEFKYEKNVKLFYVAECFRGEKPQKGRYRQFTQLGVEIINPTIDYNLPNLATKLITPIISDFKINLGVKRGLDYYEDGSGFEITCDRLGSSKQIVGGGSYKGGIGFAIGVDRILNV